MNKARMSIKPEYALKIVDGTKKFEYRKVKFRKEVKTIIIYVTHPIQKVVGEVELIKIHEGSPGDIWDKTNTCGGIDKTKYFEYFHNKKKAYAYELGEVKIYENSKSLNDIGIYFAPQSFVYFQSE